MAQFRGGVIGNRGVATRLGSKSSGLTTWAEGWRGRVTVDVWTDDDGGDHYLVRFGPHGSSGGTTLAEGVLDAAAVAVTR